MALPLQSYFPLIDDHADVAGSLAMTLTGSWSSVSDTPFGSGTSMRGATNSTVTQITGPELSLTEWAASFWIKSNKAVTGGSDWYLLAISGGFSTGFYVFALDGGGGTHDVKAYVGTGDLVAASGLTPGEWVNVVVQCDGTSTDVWINGTLGLSEPPVSLVLGGSDNDFQGLGYSSANNADVRYSDFGVISRVLTPAEIAEINTGKRLDQVGVVNIVQESHESLYQIGIEIEAQHETLYESAIARNQNLTLYQGGQPPLYQLDGAWASPFESESLRLPVLTRMRSVTPSYQEGRRVEVTLVTEENPSQPEQPEVVVLGTELSSLFYTVPFRMKVGADLPLTAVSFRMRVGERLVSERNIDQEWVLDVIRSERVFQMEWELVTQDTTEHQREVNQSWQLNTYTQQEWEFNQSWGLGEVSAEFNQRWAIPQWDWIPRILALMNQDRADQNRINFLSNWDGNFPEIATEHARNMRRTGVYAHESSEFPDGYETLFSRMAKTNTPYSWASENIMFVSFDTSDLEAYPYVTPEIAFNVWRDSPGHYGNYTSARPEGADLRAIVGLEFLVRGNNVEGYEDSALAYAVMKYVDLALYGDEPMIKEREFNQTYRADGAILEVYNSVWESDAYAEAKSQHLTDYAIKVGVGHETKMGMGVSAQHEAPLFYTLSVLHLSLYGQPIEIAGQHETLFGDSLPAKAQNRSDWGDAPQVQADHEGVYGEAPTATRFHETQYEPALVVVASNETDWILRAVLATGHESKYGDQVLATAQLETRFDINVTNPVIKGHSSFYTLIDDSPLIVSDNISVTIEGVAVEYDAVSVSHDEGDIGWRGTLTLSEVSQYAQVRKGDSVAITLGGEVYAMVVESKSLNRAEVVEKSMELGLLSPTIVDLSLESEQVSRVQDTPIKAHALVESILGRTVVWNVLDWTIPAYRYAVRNVTKAAAAQRVADACGAILETNPDGTLVVNYQYPEAMNALSVSGADFLLTDDDDNISQRESLGGFDVINRIRIRELPSAVSDDAVFEPDEVANDKGKIYVYPQPWRSNVTLQPTRGGALTLNYLGVVSRQETEQVEFVEGEASLRYPAVTIDTVEWKSASLGSVGGEARTPRVYASDTSVNYGYGLADVTYTVEALVYEVQFPVGQSAQFIVVDTGG